MPITAAEAGTVEALRGRVLESLRASKRSQPEFSVIDVGGSYNPWADDVADAYVDLFPAAADKRFFCGNICEPEVWEEIRAAGQRYDFSICSHVLEDVRDPLFVIRNLTSVSRAGYLSVPTKHSELSNVESDYYLGYCHHRWIFTVRPEEGVPRLLAVGKFPVVGYFNSRWRPLLKLFHLLGRSIWLAKAERRLGVFPAGGDLRWIRRELVGHHTELGVWWQHDLDFVFINNDFSGFTCLEAADLYRHELRDGE